MKKNKAMRAASVMAIGTLLTSCILGGTFAKYTTEDSAYDVARVAKWGVELAMSGNLYGTNYEDAVHGNQATTGDHNISVEGTQIGDTSVVAPGTNSTEGLAFSLNGTPEVKNTVKLNITSANVMLKAGTYGMMVQTDNVTPTNVKSLSEGGELYYSNDAVNFYQVEGVMPEVESTTEFYTLEDYVKGTTDYYPVEYTLAGTTKYAAGDNQADKHGYKSDSIAEMSAVIAEKINDTVVPAHQDGLGNDTVANVYSYQAETTNDANVDLASLGLDDENIGWIWHFENPMEDPNDGIGNDASSMSKKDTILGNLMAQVVDQVNADDDFAGIVVMSNDTGYAKVMVASETVEVYDADSIRTDEGDTHTKEITNYYAYVGDNTAENVVANLSTFFYIDMEATQVD